MVEGFISTIIPVFNRASMLKEAVGSVLKQTYRPIEIIIVDDGSTDKTSNVVDQLATDQPSIITAIHIKSSGPGPAREAGRKIARGEFIQYLDSDDILMPDKFKMQVEGLRKNPDCGVSYGKTRYYHINDSPKDIPLKRTGERIPTMFPAFLQSRWWSTSTPLFRSVVTDKAGPWTDLRNEEDWEYDCRIASQNIKLHYCDTFVSDTRDHEDNRLCRDGSIDPVKLKDRAIAHKLILGHALKAGIDKDEPEMKHFARELFLLSRQCGAAGLTVESKLLFDLAIEASDTEAASALDFKIYRLGANLIGWCRMGKIARQLDKLRP